VGETRIAEGPRIDPRIKALMGFLDLPAPGVDARCRRVVGTIHGTEMFPMMCPDISHDTALSIADFARTAGT
jgi:hypothetical protein